MFKVGDRVKRIKYGFKDLKVGDVGVVGRILDAYTLSLVNHARYYIAECFELIEEETKPDITKLIRLVDLNQRIINGVAQSAANHGITLDALRVLVCINKDDRPSDIMERTGLSAVRVSVMADKLSDNGYLGRYRKNKSSDRRRVFFRVTRAGKKMMDQVCKEQGEICQK